MDKARICVVFVTPGKDSGGQEFKSLELAASRRKRDRKVHISWENGLLTALKTSFKEVYSDDVITKLVSDGYALTERILKYHKQKDRKTERTPERLAIEDFMKDVKERLRKLMRLERDLKLTAWRSPRLEQIYGHIEGDNANVYFGILPEHTSVTRSKKAALDTVFELKIAGKAPKSYRKTFESISEDEWSAMLGVDHNLDIDSTRYSVSWIDSWSGSRDELVDRSVATFYRALLTFRPFMRKP